MKNIDITAKMAELAELLEYKAATEALIDGIKDEIKVYMHQNSVDEVETGAGKATWREVSTTRFSTTAFKSDHADLYEKYATVSKTKRFTFNS